MRKLVLSSSIALVLSLLASKVHAEGFAGWVYAESPPLGLVDQTTLIPVGDGSVVALGAAGGTVQEYNLLTQSWTTGGALFFPRMRHATVRLPDGRVLVCGGARIRTDGEFADYWADAEIYDHATRAFTVTGRMGWYRLAPVATLSCDDRTEPMVLVTGGKGTKSDDPHPDDSRMDLSTAEIYRASTGQWEPAPPMSAPRVRHTATCIPGRGTLVVGGSVPGVVGEDVPELGEAGIATVELFDPVARTWKTVAPLRTPRFGHTATLLSNGRVLVAGGVSMSSTYLASAELYDSEADAWTDLPPLAVPRVGAAQTLLAGDRALVAGGITMDADGANQTFTADVYEPAPGSASGGAELRRMPFSPMILSRARFPMALVGGETLIVMSLDQARSTETLQLSREGTPCEQSFECKSGFCTDGVCCSSACDSACSVCSRARGSSADGACEELPCRDHLSCERLPGGEPVCFGECQSAEECRVGYACDPTSHVCVEPHSTFVSEGCALAAPGAPPSGRWPWFASGLLALVASRARGAARARRQGRARRLASLLASLLGLVCSGCEYAGVDSLCEPFSQCGDMCVNTRVDTSNCGACGNACDASELCIDGVCGLACAGGTTLCGDRCVDLAVDPGSCGGCGSACRSGHVCEDGACALPGGLRSYIFPGGSTAGGVYAEAPPFVLVADGPATIHYTVDGTVPAPGQPGTSSGRSPLTLPTWDPPESGQRRIQWYADYDLLGREDTVHSYLAVIEEGTQKNFGALVQPVRFSPDGAPLVVVASGGAVTGTVDHALWNSVKSGYCPTCVVQLYVGLQGKEGSLRCSSVDEKNYHIYPGKEGTFIVQTEAPVAPGRYALRWWLDLGNGCDLGKPALAPSEEVGLVIVQ